MSMRPTIPKWMEDVINARAAEAGQDPRDFVLAALAHQLTANGDDPEPEPEPEPEETLDTGPRDWSLVGLFSGAKEYNCLWPGCDRGKVSAHGAAFIKTPHGPYKKIMVHPEHIPLKQKLETALENIDRGHPSGFRPLHNRKESA
jgi:hypothetical protein